MGRPAPGGARPVPGGIRPAAGRSTGRTCLAGLPGNCPCLTGCATSPPPGPRRRAWTGGGEERVGVVGPPPPLDGGRLSPGEAAADARTSARMDARQLADRSGHAAMSRCRPGSTPVCSASAAPTPACDANSLSLRYLPPTHSGVFGTEGCRFESCRVRWAHLIRSGDGKSGRPSSLRNSLCRAAAVRAASSAATSSR